MYLSNLQKFILLECVNNKTDKISCSRLKYFYNRTKKRPQEKLITKIITQSIKRLINKEFLAVYGQRTTHKWFIKEIKLTLKGQHEAKKLLGQQMPLPFKKKHKK